eukprot:gene22509-9896_t
MAVGAGLFEPSAPSATSPQTIPLQPGHSNRGTEPRGRRKSIQASKQGGEKSLRVGG